MKNFLLASFLLVVSQAFSQTIHFGDKVTMDLESNITIRDAYLSEGQVLVVGHVRKNGDIDSYLALLNQEGKVLSSFSSQDENSFSQFVKIIEAVDGYYILENNSSDIRSKVIVHKFNKNLEAIAQWMITENISNIGRDLCRVGLDNLLVAVWDGSSAVNSFPVVYKLNMESGQKKSINLDKKNTGKLNFAEPDANWTEEQKESFCQLADYEEAKMIKQVNKLILDGDNIYVLGSENTDNISDYWMCNLDLQLNIKWEYLYEEVGVFGTDWLLDGSIKDNKINLLGYRYNKGKTGYDFNFLVSDRNGEIETNKIHDLGHHEMVYGMLEFDEMYLQFGTGSNSLSSYGSVDTPQKRMLLMLLNDQGNLLDKKETTMAGLEKIKKGLKINDSTFLLIGEAEIKRKTSHFFLKGQIINKEIRP